MKNMVIQEWLQYEDQVMNALISLGGKAPLSKVIETAEMEYLSADIIVNPAIKRLIQKGKIKLQIGFSLFKIYTVIKKV